jgi:hypothetical protein
MVQGASALFVTEASFLMPITLPSPSPFSRLQYSFVEQGFDPHALIDDMKSIPRLSPPPHAPAPPAPITVPIEYMGHAFHLQLPAIALSATLAYCARLDAFPLMTTSDLPLTRAQTTPPGLVTLEDVEYYHRFFSTRTVPRGPGSPTSPLQPCLGSRHDWDWQRAVALEPAMSRRPQRYTPGILTGKWRGIRLVRPAFFPCYPTTITNISLPNHIPCLIPSCDDDDDDPPLPQAPFDRDFTPFMTGAAGPAAMPDSSRHPFFCHLEEHVRYSDVESPLPGSAQADSSNFPLLPQTNWFRREVRAFMCSHRTGLALCEIGMGLTYTLFSERVQICRFYPGILSNLQS